MSSNNLSFLDDGQSIASTVSQLHHYFQQTYSRYEIKHGEMVNHLHDGTKNPKELQEELQQLEEALALVGVLTDSLSVANRVLHSDSIARILGSDTDLFKIHLEDEAEQAAERAAAQRRLANRKD
jgi:hypothetical protein